MLWTLLAVVILVIAVPVALYIPAVQDFARKIAVEKVEASTGMKISIDYLRLKFPLKLSLEGVGVVEASGDTMATVGRLGLNVRLLPLLKGDVEIGRAEGDSIFYQMGNRDSVMWLRALVRRFELDASGLELKNNRIEVDRAFLDGGDVSLRMLPDTTTVPEDTVKSAPWFIHARDIELRDLTYRMEMLPTIDSLGAYIQSARLTEGTVDMARYRIHARDLAVDSVSAVYLTPTAAYLKAHPAPETPPSKPTPENEQWTVTADHLLLTGREATYAVRGARPLPGLDMSYLQARDIYIEVDSFYNKLTTVRVPLRRLAAVERCGLPIEGSGLFEMDSTIMKATGFDVSTALSSLQLTGSMGVGDIMTDPSLPLMLKANATISPADVITAMPSMRPMLKALPAGDLTIVADIEGTPSRLDVRAVDVRHPRLLTLKASGTVFNLLDPKRLGGDVSLDGSLRNANALKPTLLQARLAKMVNIPDITLKGDIKYRPEQITANLKGHTGGGDLLLDGRWNGRAESYDARLNLRDFPVDHFLPTMGVGDVTASLSATGHGYNPLKPSTRMDVKADLAHVSYQKADYRDILLTATVADGEATGNLNSANPGADLTVDFTAEIDGDEVALDLDGDVRDLDLRRLNLMTDTMGGSLALTGRGVYNTRTGAFSLDADVDDLRWEMPGYHLETPRVTAAFVSNDSVLSGRVENGDLFVNLYGNMPLETFMKRVMAATDTVMRQVDRRRIDVNEISRALPGFTLSGSVGNENLAAELLGPDMKFRNATFDFRNDSVLTARARVLQFQTGSTRLDTIAFTANQRDSLLRYKVYVNNRPGTFDDFAYVSLDGFVGQDKMMALFRQKNIQGENGFWLGFRVDVADSVARLKFVPYKPTIAYQQWAVNEDNFVSYNFASRHIDANLALENNKSYVKLFTNHVAGDTTHSQEDITLQLQQIRLQDWLSISPFAPPVKGDLSADMKFRWNAHDITGHGLVSLADLFYGRERVGDFDVDLDIMRQNDGFLRADASLMVDSVKTITASGYLNDTTRTSPFLLDFKMIRFPLAVVNPFLPQGTAKLSGMLNGEMDITGEMTSPIFNGYLDFDTTAVTVTMLGTDFRFSETKIPVDSNIIKFNDFNIMGCNKNPLVINGEVDARKFSDIKLDLSMKARDMQIVDSKRPRSGADAYGKAFVDLDATARGSLSLMVVNADLKLLSGTNVTYRIPTFANSLTSKANEGMVRFVSFNDTTQVAQADSIAPSAMALYLDANLAVEEGSTVAVEFSGGKAQIQPSGQLAYTMTPMATDGRVTGRLNLNGGYVKYNPPFMSEKDFKFQEGSYVAFNGDMLNPTLNVHAVDEMKANVTQEGQNSRLVNFDVLLSITQTLENMNVAFDLQTNDDITVQNELASMSAEQRANQAMNLLLYNVYTGANTKATANLSGNPLYSFLTSQVNNWVANNIRGVDLSFGIDQYDKTYDGSTSTATSYSYKVSKSLFNDRFKIIVGGNYSTDADADENFSQNLINDISFEYMLNKNGSMYVRIFRHTGFESILEGEVTQTGFGFVLKRKLRSLRDIFGVRRKQPVTQPAPTDEKK